MTTATVAAYELRLSVQPADIDEQEHVNNVVYLRWCQEAATAHWRRVAPPESQQAIGWVVLRHEIDYKAAAVLADEIVVRTWVGNADGLAFERFTEILRASDRQLLASARTLWCPINAKTGRPKRVSRELRGLFSTSRGTAA